MFVLLTTVAALAQSSEGTALADLPGRSLAVALPRLTTQSQVEGVVVVAIKVDESGNVTEASAVSEGSTISNKSIWNAAISAALRAHFNQSTETPSIQSGTITYKFVSSNLAFIDETALKFVGVPIGGTKEHMTDALKAKGFNYSYLYECLTGIFNGENVKVYLSTNHDVVDKIRVEYPPYSGSEIRVKYDVLRSRFNRNAKYLCVNPIDEAAAGGEYNNDAIYFYLHPSVNSRVWLENFKQEYQKRYKKPLQNLSYEEMEEVLFCLPMKVAEAVSGVVCLSITPHSHINIDYINFKNRPRGEDL